MEISVSGNEIKQSGKNCGVCGEGNATELKITFGEDWNGYAKRIVFYNALGGEPTAMILSGSGAEYIIKIPYEALQYEGDIEYVIEGTADGAKKKTVAGKMCVRYAPPTDGAGAPEDVTPSQAEQLQELIETEVGQLNDKLYSEGEKFSVVLKNSLHETEKTAKEYADEKDSDMLESAKAYADEKDGEVLESAKVYADEKGEELEPKITQTDLNAYNYAQTASTDAKAYADEKDCDVLTAAKGYADRGDSDVLTVMKLYADSGDSDVLSNAQTYTDNQIRAAHNGRRVSLKNEDDIEIAPGEAIHTYLWGPDDSYQAQGAWKFDFIFGKVEGVNLTRGENDYTYLISASSEHIDTLVWLGGENTMPLIITDETTDEETQILEEYYVTRTSDTTCTFVAPYSELSLEHGNTFLFAQRDVELMQNCVVECVGGNYLNALIVTPINYTSNDALCHKFFQMCFGERCNLSRENRYMVKTYGYGDTYGAVKVDEFPQPCDKSEIMLTYSGCFSENTGYSVTFDITEGEILSTVKSAFFPKATEKITADTLKHLPNCEKLHIPNTITYTQALTDFKGELVFYGGQPPQWYVDYQQSELKKIAVPYSDVRGTPTLELMHCLAGEHLRHFEINGKTSKNLIPYPYKNLSQGGTNTHEGITLTDNGDGSITADGTATGEAWIQVSVFDCAAGDFCLSGAPSGSSTATYFLQFAGIRDYGESTAFTLDEEKSGTLYIYVHKGQTLSNVVFRPMLETGSTKSDYEIYGGVGDLDPSTNKYKIPIVFVTGGSSSEIIDVILDTPLKEGETLDLIRQTRRSAEGETHIELSKSLPTLGGGGNNNWLICNTAVKPAYMFAEYWRDISTSLTEIIYRIRNIESLLNIDGGTLSIDD